MRKKLIFIFMVVGILLFSIGLSLALKQEKVQQLDINSNKIQKLYQMIKYDNTIAHNNPYLLINNKVKNGNIDEGYKFEKSVYNLSNEKMKIDTNKCLITINKKDIDNNMDLLFNNHKYSLKKSYGMYLKIKNDKCGNVVDFVYNKKTDTFESNIAIAGGMNSFKSLYPTKLIKAYKKGDKIYLEEKVLYLEEKCNENNMCKYDVYVNSNHTIKIGTTENIKIEDSYDFIEQYKMKATIIKYTFKKSKKHYYFDSKVDKQC